MKKCTPLLIFISFFTSCKKDEGKQQLMQEIVDQVKIPFVPKGSPQKVVGVFFTSFVVQ